MKNSLRFRLNFVSLLLATLFLAGSVLCVHCTAYGIQFITNQVENAAIAVQNHLPHPYQNF